MHDCGYRVTGLEHVKLHNLPHDSFGSDMVRIPSDREPTHPGKMLLQEFLIPLNMTQRALATAIQVPFQRVNELDRGRCCDSPGFSVRPLTSGSICNCAATSTTPAAPRLSRSVAFNTLKSIVPCSAPKALGVLLDRCAKYSGQFDAFRRPSMSIHYRRRAAEEC